MCQGRGCLGKKEEPIVPNDTVGDLAVQVMLPAVDGFRDPYLWTEAGALLRKVE